MSTRLDVNPWPDGAPSFNPTAAAACAPARQPAWADTADAVPSGWYVCLTKPRQEAYAASKLQEQGYDVYLPQYTSWARRAGQWCQKQGPLFPRYAFVRPAHSNQAVGPIRSTPGVTSMVRFGPVLAVLTDMRLVLLRQAVQARNALPPGQPFSAGQMVVFSQGPLAGLQGMVSSVAAERVTVLLQLLGQDQNVQVPFQHLKAAEYPANHITS